MIHRRRLLVEICKLADLVIMVGVFFGVLWLAAIRTQGQSLLDLLRDRYQVSDLLLYLGLVFVWHLILRTFGLYRSERLSTRWAEAADVFKATSLGSLAVIGLAIILDVEPLSYWRWSLAVFWITSTTAIIALRLLLCYIFMHLSRLGLNLRSVLIIGTNVRARRFAEKIRSLPELGYRVIGFVDEGCQQANELQDSGEKLVTDLDGLGEFLRTNVVDEVVLTLPVGSFYPQVTRIVRLCGKRKVIVRFLSEMFNPRSARIRVEMLQDHPVLTIDVANAGGWARTAKRFLDISASLALLMALGPLFLILVLASKLASPGPVFRAREHVGLNKRRFQLYTLRIEAVEAQENLTESTKLGRLLRRTGLDGWPQLFNVLKGDMSLVGPRPLTPRDYEGLTEDRHRRWFIVRPGLTCLERITDDSKISFARWMDLDVRYADRWTLRLDLEILARTLLVMLKAGGALPRMKILSAPETESERPSIEIAESKDASSSGRLA